MWKMIRQMLKYNLFVRLFWWNKREVRYTSIRQDGSEDHRPVNERS